MFFIHKLEHSRIYGLSSLSLSTYWTDLSIRTIHRLDFKFRPRDTENWWTDVTTVPSPLFLSTDTPIFPHGVLVLFVYLNLESFTTWSLMLMQSEKNRKRNNIEKEGLGHERITKDVRRKEVKQYTVFQREMCSRFDKFYRTEGYRYLLSTGHDCTLNPIWRQLTFLKGFLLLDNLVPYLIMRFSTSQCVITLTLYKKRIQPNFACVKCPDAYKPRMKLCLVKGSPRRY